MGKLLKTIVFAIIYLIISYFLALQIAWLLSFNFDILALSQQPKLFGLFSFTIRMLCSGKEIQTILN